MEKFEKILVANRVMRAAHELNKKNVEVYAEQNNLSFLLFKPEEAQVIQALLVGINGSGVPVQQSKDVLWGENVLPLSPHVLAAW